LPSSYRYYKEDTVPDFTFGRRAARKAFDLKNFGTRWKETIIYNAITANKNKLACYKNNEKKKIC